jgi:hypothetical protein
MTISELILVGGATGLVLLIAFYLTHRSMVLVDRLTDKIMSDKNPQAYVAYATTTPTVKEEQFSHPGNGKAPVRTPGLEELPSYLEVE